MHNAKAIELRKSTLTTPYFAILQEHSTLKGLRGKTCQMHIKDKEREPIGNG